MASQLHLFKLKKFRSMFATQFLGSFNDNTFKQALLLILTYIAAAQMQASISVLNNLAAMLFILPYFLFSALAGQIADKYEKSKLTRYIKILEICIALLATVGLLMQWYWLLFVALFLLGTQSTFFGPIKYAYLPQTMNKNELVGANGLFQTGTSLSILLGMIFAGLLTQQANATLWVCISIITIAVLGYFAATRIPLTPAMQPELTINWNIASTSWQTIKYLSSLPLLFFVVLGISWFWFYGATFLTQTPEFSKVILHGDESVVIFMLTLFTIGVAVGSLLCKTLTKNQISLRLLPFGIVGLSIFAIDLYFALSAIQINNTQLLGVSELLSTSGSIRIFIDLFCLGFSGGLFIVPLYSFLQAYAPESHRARIIGANNIFNAFYMVVAAIFSIIMLNLLKLTLPQLFLVTGILNLIYGMGLYLKLKKHHNSLSLQTHGN